MANHEDLLRMDSEDFSVKIGLIEWAFRDLSAAYFFEPRSGLHVVDVFDFFDGVKDVNHWIQLRSFARQIAELLFFAFEGAPHSAVNAWGEEHVTGAGKTAVERVEAIRSSMPTAHNEWITRFTNLGPVFGDFRSTHVYNEDIQEHRTVVRLDSFFAEGVRRVPIASSRQYWTAVMSRNDVRRLIDQLRMADAMYDELFEEEDAPEETDGGE